MPVIDIQTMDEYEPTRLANPDALIRLVLGGGRMTLFFPSGHGMARFEVH